MRCQHVGPPVQFDAGIHPRLSMREGKRKRESSPRLIKHKKKPGPKKAKKNSIDEAKKTHLAASVKGSWYNQPQLTPQPSASNETGKEVGASRLNIIAFDFRSPDFVFSIITMYKQMQWLQIERRITFPRIRGCFVTSSFRGALC